MTEFPYGGNRHVRNAVCDRRGFLVTAGIMLLAAVVTAAMIRIRKADLADVNPV